MKPYKLKVRIRNKDGTFEDKIVELKEKVIKDGDISNNG